MRHGDAARASYSHLSGGRESAASHSNMTHPMGRSMKADLFEFVQCFHGLNWLNYTVIHAQMVGLTRKIWKEDLSSDNDGLTSKSAALRWFKNNIETICGFKQFWFPPGMMFEIEGPLWRWQKTHWLNSLWKSVMWNSPKKRWGLPPGYMTHTDWCHRPLVLSPRYWWAVWRLVAAIP